MHHELKDNLLKLAAEYRAATGVSFSGSGKSIMNDSTFFQRVEGGDGFNVKTYDRVVEWFALNWPRGKRWPSGISRPIPDRKGAAA